MGADYNLSSLPTPEPSEAPLLDLPARLQQQQQQELSPVLSQGTTKTGMGAEFQSAEQQPLYNWEDIDLAPEASRSNMSPSSASSSIAVAASSSFGRITGDILATAMLAGDVIPLSDSQQQQQQQQPSSVVADVIPTDSSCGSVDLKSSRTMVKQLQCGKCGRKFKYKQFMELHQRDCSKVAASAANTC